jgi:hypothetical protein
MTQVMAARVCHVMSVLDINKNYMKQVLKEKNTPWKASIVILEWFWETQDYSR